MQKSNSVVPLRKYITEDGFGIYLNRKNEKNKILMCNKCWMYSDKNESHNMYENKKEYTENRIIKETVVFISLKIKM